MKKLLVCLVVLMVFFSSSICVVAKEDFTNNLKDEYYNKLFESLSDDSKEMIESIGLNDLNYQKLSDLSPSDFFSFFINAIKGNINGAIKNFIIIFSLIILVSAFFTYIPQNEKMKNILNSLSCVIIALIITPSLVSLLKASMSAIDIASKFMLVFIPILAGLIASCSNPVMAVSMNSVTIYIANLISHFSNKVLVPFMSIYYAISLSNCVSSEIDLKSLSEYIKNFVTKCLAIVSSFFISFLSLKGIFTNSVDTVTTRGAKLLISSTVPVIGANLSEAYSAVSGSLTLLKSSIGIFGIIALATFYLPIIIELSFWGLSFSLCSMISQTMGLNNVSTFLNSICNVVKTINLILIFSAVIFIISTGIMITIRSSV